MNLAVNTSITVYAVVFAPLTYLIGPPATFLVILTLNLVATALAWYWLLSRHLVRSRLAAAVGALFIAYSPGMVSHANAHLNWTAGWLVPLLIWRLFALRRPGHWLRDGVCSACWSRSPSRSPPRGCSSPPWRSAVVRGRLGAAPGPPGRGAAPRCPTSCAGSGVTAVVAGVLLSYPLWLHFAGPQRFHGTGFDPVIHSEDIAAFVAFPRRSLAGEAGLGTSLAPNPTEENSFFGVPLLVLTVVCFVVLWRRADPGRRATLWALGVIAVVFTVLSWGPPAKSTDAAPTCPCRSTCWTTCRWSTPRCRPGWPWWWHR